MRVTVGRHGTLTADEARKQAARIIARIKAGESPVLDEPVADPTVGDPAERYQREYVAMHCKPATVSHYGLMLRKHIVPALGEHLVREVERKHILEFQYGLSSMLRWEDLDFEAGEMRLADSKTGVSRHRDAASSLRRRPRSRHSVAT